jgi:hypothetical protein
MRTVKFSEINLLSGMEPMANKTNEEQEAGGQAVSTVWFGARSPWDTVQREGWEKLCLYFHQPLPKNLVFAFIMNRYKKHSIVLPRKKKLQHYYQ